MYDRNPYPIDVSLLEMADQDYLNLMDHPTNRDDAMQVLCLVQSATNPEDRVQAGHHALAWLQWEIGQSEEKPDGFGPQFFPPGELSPGRILARAEECQKAWTVAA